MERLIQTEDERKLFMKFLKEHKLPFRVNVWGGRSRSIEQNRLQRMWCNEISDQLGDLSPEEVRGYCKLTMGVPILRAENQTFHDQYDRILKPLAYEHKIAIMMEPLDLPVTRIMTVKQKSAYLDAIHKHFTEKGVKLTEPEHLAWL